MAAVTLPWSRDPGSGRSSMRSFYAWPTATMTPPIVTCAKERESAA